MLNNKTVLFQVIQFSISMQLSSIWPIDSENLGVMAMKGYSAFPKASTLLEPYHQIV